MKIKLFITISFAAIVFLLFGFVKTGNDPVSAETQECVDCHRTITPGIVADWENGLHSKTTPNQAKANPEYERRISSANIPENPTPVINTIWNPTFLPAKCIKKANTVRFTTIG